MFNIFNKHKDKQGSDELKSQLIDLYNKKDINSFIKLCQSNMKVIRDNYRMWANFPEEIRNLPTEKLNKYAQPIIAIADVFNQMGDASLFEMLQGNTTENPIEKWKSSILSSQKFVQNGKLIEAMDVLKAIIPEIENSKGNAKDEFLPKVYGHLGIISYHQKDLDGAINHTNKALVMCREIQDLEGVVAYAGTLLEIMSQVGLKEEDNKLAKERVATLRKLGRNEEASKYESQYDA